ncbi:MAG: alanyl-tRNA editing protein [Gammaproteobacteria bacterium]|nr:alanyl-tRNA editing protein [Gammaproteobacteria bacterium]
MVEKLFWQDPYLTELETSIRTVDGDSVTLDQTIFFAISGGQESDHGSIGGFEVLEASNQGRQIVYQLPPAHGLQPGDRVRVRIDWDRRYRLMRNHFAAELILELIYRALPGIEKIGAHIAVDKARIDFAWAANLSAQFPGLIAEASRLIEQDLPIISAYADEQQQRRYWALEGFARVPCGGTHLKSTGEVGSISLKRKNIGNGKERVEIYTNPNDNA